jgi:hypothetical protein
MNVIFCISYLSVPETITLVESSSEDFMIVLSNDEMFSFFKRIYPEEKLVLINYPGLTKNPFRFVYNLFSLIRYKRKVWSRFESIQGESVYFFIVAFCNFHCWLIKRLSLKNTIYYRPSISLSGLREDESLTARFGVWIRKLLYDCTFKPLMAADFTYYAVSDNYLEDIRAKDYAVIKSFTNISDKIISSLGNIKSAKILILCGGAAGVFCDKDKYIVKMDSLIGYLVKQYGYDALAIKAHPRFQDYHSKEKSLKKIPEDIPANLILDNFDVVIGYASATLVEAANAEIKSISLLKWIIPKKVDTQEYYINYLNKNSKNNIIYLDFLGLDVL